MGHTQIYGRNRRKNPPPPQTKRNPRKFPDTADLILVLGSLAVGVFLYRMTMGTAEIAMTSPSQEGVVAVMSTAVDSGGEKAEIPEPTSGDPFGYMGGEWNFWEYLGDLMASLLGGG